MAKIERIEAREVLDSRGNPTVMAEVLTAGNIRANAMVPSGASTGKYEDNELRDGDPKRYSGKGVTQAVEHITTEIQAALIGKDTANQDKLDRTLISLDGTPTKERLGANAILAVSLAAARAEALAQGLPLYLYLQQLFPKREPTLPVPQMNLINGGKHATNNLAIQEFHVVPVGAASFKEALRMGVEIHAALKKILIEAGLAVGLGDEGGYDGGAAPALDESEEAFAYMTRAIEEAGYVPGVDAFLGIDAAASEFLVEEGRYHIDGSVLTAKDLGWRYKTWNERHPLISIEDPFGDDAWDEWRGFTAYNAKGVQIVGDDLYATNPQRIQQGITSQAANAVLIKPNQVGTLTETLKAILMAQEAGHRVIISHRSGETADTFIADLAVAVGAGQIKTGAPARSDRTAKYNRLLKIEESIEGAYAKPFRELLSQNQPARV